MYTFGIFVFFNFVFAQKETQIAGNTATSGIYALGDVTGEKELTPVAIKAGRTLAERLFNGKSEAKTALRCRGSN